MCRMLGYKSCVGIQQKRAVSGSPLWVPLNVVIVSPPIRRDYLNLLRAAVIIFDPIHARCKCDDAASG